MPLLSIGAGLVVLPASGELLIRGASACAARLGVPPLVMGLTVVAFGTSAPERVVSLDASLSGHADVAVGNVVGSNLANVLLILGLSAAASPLVVSPRLLRWDLPWMVGASAMLFFCARDGRISRGEGAAFVVLGLAYVAWSLRGIRLTRAAATTGGPAEVARGARLHSASLAGPAAAIAGGILGLAAGAHWLVAGAVAVATLLGVPELVIGLTIVSVGTSLPELVASVMASLRGEREIAVGNVVGSNLFNILVVAGLSAVVAPQGLAVAEQALAVDLPAMVLAAAVCLPIFLSGLAVARWEGALLVGYYGIYLAWLAATSSGSPWAEILRQAVAWRLGPLTLVALAVSLVRSRLPSHSDAPRNDPPR